jgi:hypothetical protein
MRRFFQSPLTDSNVDPLLTIEQRGGRAGKAGESWARKPRKKKDRPNTGDGGWTSVPGLAFPQCSLGVAGEERQPGAAG